MSEKQTENKRSMNTRSMYWMKERREALSLNQEEFTVRLQLEGIDVSRPTVSSWETGRHRPPLDDVRFREALAKVLKLPESQILKMSGYKVGAIPHTEVAERIASIVDSLEDEKQEMVLKMVEALL